MKELINQSSVPRRAQPPLKAFLHILFVQLIFFKVNSISIRDLSTLLIINAWSKQSVNLETERVRTK